VNRYVVANRAKVILANKIAVKRYAQNNPEKRLASKKRWSAANRELEKAIVRESSKRWYWNNRDKAKARYRAWMRANLPSLRVRNAKRGAQQLKAMPEWAEVDKIAFVYKMARRWGFEVDHVVPLQHPSVCGLHVWANLQVLSKEENSRKRNRHWPDMP
jgi:hypothetical protein